MRARIAVAAALALAATVLVADAAATRTYRYTLESRGNVHASLDRFAAIGAATLSDIRGWTLNHNIRYVQVSAGPDFRLILASPASVDAASPMCSSQWSCRVGTQILINDVRWRKATPTWPLSRRKYRSYVINHEVGHWLGLGHWSCPKSGATAPVMMQQSKGLGSCSANVWPKFAERRRVAAIRSVARWPIPPWNAPCSLEGTKDDDRLVGTSHADVICGYGGDDELRGKGGHDVLRGGGGHDLLGSGLGRDVARGGAGDDTVVGGPGADRLFGGRGDDTIFGRGGPDRIVGRGGADRLFGERGDDHLDGEGGHDVCRGGSGSNTLRNCEESA